MKNAGPQEDVRIEPLKSWLDVINPLKFIIYLIKFQFTFIYFISCIIPYKHSDLYLLHCSWLRCIRSCMEDFSHGCLLNRWFVHNQFIGLGKLLKVVMHHLLIRGMAHFGYRDEFPMVSVLVCMVTYWIRPLVSHDLRLSSRHDLTKLFHCVVS